MNKKISLALAGLTLSGLSSAGSMGPVCAPGDVTVPCAGSAWELGVTALYLEQMYGHDVNYYGFTVENGAERYHSYDDWNWGFKLEAAYHFNTGNDLNINWYHYNSTNDFYGSVFNDDLNVNVDQRNNLHTKWDAVNAELGQFVNFSAHKSIRFHGGVQYVNMRTNDYVYDLPTNTLNKDTWSSSFSGFGARTGLDMHYAFDGGFGVYAKGAVALLLGNNRFNSFQGRAIGLTTSGNPQRGERHAVVPAMDARLGADYKYVMSQGDITLDAGYMWFNYFQTVNFNPVNADSNFSFSGPYVGLKYLGNV